MAGLPTLPATPTNTITRAPPPRRTKHRMKKPVDSKGQRRAAAERTCRLPSFARGAVGDARYPVVDMSDPSDPDGAVSGAAAAGAATWNTGCTICQSARRSISSACDPTCDTTYPACQPESWTRAGSRPQLPPRADAPTLGEPAALTFTMTVAGTRAKCSWSSRYAATSRSAASPTRTVGFKPGSPSARPTKPCTARTKPISAAHVR